MAAVAAWAIAGQAEAQTPPPKDDASILSFSFENDVFASTDRHYTSGVRFSFMTQPADDPGWVRNAANWLPFVDPQSAVRFEYAVGQSIYTPHDIKLRYPDPDDRPYAGWLYTTIGLVAETGSTLDQFQIGLGVVGPWSLAEQTQTLVHEVTGATRPEGWGDQLHNEPTVQIFYQRSWRAFASGQLFGFEIDATPHVGGALGNALTYANAGFTIRLGYELPQDFGPPRLAPVLAGSSFFRPQERFGWYLFAGVDGRAVARNIFLDGNTFRDSPSVDKYPLVGDLQFGAAIVIGGTRIAYTHVFRTKEFETQDKRDSYGALTVSVRF